MGSTGHPLDMGDRDPNAATCITAWEGGEMLSGAGGGTIAELDPDPEHDEMT